MCGQRPTYRVYVYWLDEPTGLIWSVDKGDQGPNGELAELYREVRFLNVEGVTRARPESNAELLAKREPKVWLEVTNAVIEVLDDQAGRVCVFHGLEVDVELAEMVAATRV